MRARTSCLKCLRDVIVSTLSRAGGRTPRIRAPRQARSEADRCQRLEDSDPLRLRKGRAGVASGQEGGREGAPRIMLALLAMSGKGEGTGYWSPVTGHCLAMPHRTDLRQNRQRNLRRLPPAEIQI